jgi:hypothetical protein
MNPRSAWFAPSNWEGARPAEPSSFFLLEYFPGYFPQIFPQHRARAITYTLGK